MSLYTLRPVELRPTDYVWIATTWPMPVVFHIDAPRDDREVTVDDHTALIAGWAFTACGVRRSEIRWDEQWSPDSGRFYVGPSLGHHLPFRLLNPDFSRPCQKCFEVAP